MSKFTYESQNDTLSEHELLIKKQLEQWISDLQKKAKLNQRLQTIQQNDKSHIQSLSEL